MMPDGPGFAEYLAGAVAKHPQTDTPAVERQSDVDEDAHDG